MSSLLRFLVALLVLTAAPARGMIAGGGDPARDCWMEFEAPGRTLNFPRAPRFGREIRCLDGEAGCDLDGAVDGKCTFDLDVCFHHEDPALPGCRPVEVVGAFVRHADDDPGLASLQAAIDRLRLACLPAEWLSHGFDRRNSRSKPKPSGIGSPPGLVAQNAATGEVLAEFALPAPVQSAPTVVDGMLFIGWGSWLDSTGGVSAFAVR